MLWNNPNVKLVVEQIARADVGQPADVAATIAYLASDDAAFVQGAEVRVDGGRLDRRRTTYWLLQRSGLELTVSETDLATPSQKSFI